MPLTSYFASTAPTGGAAGQPHRGLGPYGQVPGPIAVPQNVYSQLSSTLPGFAGMSGGASNIIGSEQSGQLSPATLNALRIGSAQMGVSSGMPGSGLSVNNLLGNIAGFSENLQHQGLTDYFGLLGATAPLQTDPNLAASIADRNAMYAAAPDPQAAAQQQMADWFTKFNATRQASMGYGGPAGGTGRPWWGGKQSAGLAPSTGIGFGAGQPSWGFTPADPTLSANSLGTGMYYNGVLMDQPPGTSTGTSPASAPVPDANQYYSMDTAPSD